MSCSNPFRHHTVRTMFVLGDAQQIIKYISHFESCTGVYLLRLIQYGAVTPVFFWLQSSISAVLLGACTGVVKCLAPLYKTLTNWPNWHRKKGFDRLTRTMRAEHKGSGRHSTPIWWTCLKLRLYNKCKEYNARLFGSFYITKGLPVQSIFGGFPCFSNQPQN